MNQHPNGDTPSASLDVAKGSVCRAYYGRPRTCWLKPHAIQESAGFIGPKGKQTFPPRHRRGCIYFPLRRRKAEKENAPAGRAEEIQENSLPFSRLAPACIAAAPNHETRIIGKALSPRQGRFPNISPSRTFVFKKSHASPPCLSSPVNT